MCKLYKEKIMYVEACGSVIQFLKSRSSRFIRFSFGENGKLPGNHWSFVFLYKQFRPRDVTLLTKELARLDSYLFTFLQILQNPQETPAPESLF